MLAEIANSFYLCNDNQLNLSLIRVNSKEIVPDAIICFSAKIRKNIKY